MPLNRREFLAHATSTSAVLALGNGLPLAGADEAKAKGPANPFLRGNWAPVREEVAAEDLKVIGKLPAEMDGMFVRNGPNPQFAPPGNYHWFEGDGMLHGVRVRGGKASYRNRYVRTQGWKEEQAAGKALYDSFLDPPDLKKLLSGKRPYKNTANTALVWHDGRLLALWEGGEPHEIKLPGLDTVGPYTYGGRLKHPFTAHPKVDPATGEMLFFGYAPFKPYVQYSVVNARGQIARTTPIDVPRPIMMHDFAVTSRHSLFMDLPMTFSIERMQRGDPLIQFEPDRGARFGILPRHGSGADIKWFEAAACYVFHTLNAYEDGPEVVLLACRTKDFPCSFFLPPGKQPTRGEVIGKEFAPRMYRWRFNLETGATKEEALDNVPCEFPRINEGYTGTNTRYGYTARFDQGVSGALIKYDFQTGKASRHAHGEGRFGGEGVFVPRPSARTEDDGWLVTYVHDEADAKSEMVVLDAQDFGKPPVARVLLPARVPHGFHGAWIAGDVLAKQG
jgi:carotenoid cleavage dioxygenase